MGNLDVTLKAGVLKLWGNKRSGNSSQLQCSGGGGGGGDGAVGSKVPK